MKPVPLNIIKRLDTALGLTGRPHLILYDGQVLDTGCMKWSPNYEFYELWSQASPRLIDAIRRWYGYLDETSLRNDSTLLETIQRWYTTIQKALPSFKQPDMTTAIPEYDRLVAVKADEFLAQEPMPVRKEFQDFLAQLGDTLPLYQATYKNGTTFDGAIQAVRTRQFWAREPADIQAEFDAYRAKSEDASSSIARIERARQAGFDANTLGKVRELLQDEPVIAYQYYIQEPELPGAIIATATTDQFDILRIARTDAANYGLGTEDVIEKLKVLDEQYGIDITSAGSDGLSLILKHIPTGDAALELWQWLSNFCPDRYRHVEPTGFLDGRVTLWCD